MKTFIRLSLLLLLLSNTSLSARERTDAAEFQALEEAWSKAIQTQNGPMLESFLAADYTLTVAQPQGLSVTTRADWLKNISVYKLHAFVFKEVAVRRYGNVAVVSSLYSQQATVNGRDRSGDAFLTDIWIKVDGRWKVSARYSSNPKTASPKGRPVEPTPSTPSRGST